MNKFKIISMEQTPDPSRKMLVDAALGVSNVGKFLSTLSYT